MKKILLFSLCCLSVCVLPLRAELRLASVFGDGAVLQRQQPVAVWGWAAPGAKVEVAFAGQTVSAVADAGGYWKTELASMEASAEGRELQVRSGGERTSLKDVLVGEVWIVAGQSNMRAGGPDKDTGVYPFYQTPADAENLPGIRVRNAGGGVSLEPLADVQEGFRDSGPWVAKDTLSDGSNPLPYYFARILRDQLQVPVGLLYLAVSGTNQTAWMSKETLEGFPGAGNHDNYYQEFLGQAEAKLEKSGGAIKSWDDFLEAQQAWFENKQGQWPGRGQTFINYPTVLYNSRVYPVAPYGVRGVIWHQGEAGPRGPYAERLVAMFNQWRELYGQDFYAIWGTLSKHTKDQPPLQPADYGFYRSWTNNDLRRAAELSAEDPKTGYVEFYDLGNDDTHFNQKAEAGRRMALAALDITYGQPQTYTGPRLINSKIEGNVVYLKFDQVGKGLVYTPSIEGISGIFVQGKNGQARWGEVKLIGPDTLGVTHPDLDEIVYVSGASTPNPHETLFNSEGIPISTFHINTGGVRPSSAEQPVKLLSIEGSGGGVNLHMSHVRRDGYMFELRERRGPQGKSLPLKLYVSSEWQGVEVEQAAKPLPFEGVVENGQRFVKVEAAVNQGPVTVADKGKAEAFRGIDRY